MIPASEFNLHSTRHLIGLAGRFGARDLPALPGTSIHRDFMFSAMTGDFFRGLRTHLNPRRDREMRGGLSGS